VVILAGVSVNTPPTKDVPPLTVPETTVNVGVTPAARLLVKAAMEIDAGEMLPVFGI
jgi:hypothetical protein